MAYQALTNNEISSGAPIDAALLTKIKNNFEAQVETVNKAVPVGTVRCSLLTLAQFQAECPGVWVIADGRNITGTAYATITGKTTVPDMRGTALRMKDNGKGLNPDGDLAIGTYQGDSFGSHTHAQDAHNHGVNDLYWVMLEAEHYENNYYCPSLNEVFWK